MHGGLAGGQRIPAAGLGRRISRGDVVLLPIHRWRTLDIRCGDVAYVGKGRLGITRVGPDLPSMETPPRARRKSGFSVVRRGCPGHYVDYRSHVCTVQSSPVGALCHVGSERASNVMECGPTGAFFPSDRCRLPCLAVPLSGGFGARVVVPAGNHGAASLARPYGFDLDDPSFDPRVTACRQERYLLQLDRTIRAGHRKHIANINLSMSSEMNVARVASQRGGRVLWKRR